MWSYLKKRHMKGDDVGLLLQGLYGTRDASANFQEEVRKVLTKAVFKRGKYNPSTNYQEMAGIKAVDHDGWHYEADQRHGELIVQAFNLQEAMSLLTPWEDEKMAGGG